MQVVIEILYASETSGGGASTETPLFAPFNTNLTVTVGGGAAQGANGSSSVFHTVSTVGGGKRWWR